jgi:prolipoprotein diacylglyceryltransferase
MNVVVPDMIVAILQHSRWQWGFWYPGMHVFFEVLGYVVSWWVLKHQTIPDVLAPEQRKALKWWTLGGAIVGAKLVPILECMGTPLWWTALITGKSLAGGLLGGILGSEIKKAKLGIASSTGDVLVLPLLVGTFIGRLGCASTAVWDDMLGVPVQFPVGLNAMLPVFSVEVTTQVAASPAWLPLPKHAGLYWNVASLECVGLMAIALLLWGVYPLLKRTFRPGALFYTFCTLYSLLRLLLEQLKHAPDSLTLVQGVSLLTLLISMLTLKRLRQMRKF